MTEWNALGKFFYKEKSLEKKILPSFMEMRSLKILKNWKLMKQVSISALLYKVKVKTLDKTWIKRYSKTYANKRGQTPIGGLYSKTRPNMHTKSSVNGCKRMF